MALSPDYTSCEWVKQLEDKLVKHTGIADFVKNSKITTGIVGKSPPEDAFKAAFKGTGMLPSTLINLRLGFRVDAKLFNFMEAVQKNDTHMVVFIVHRGESVMIEDEVNLFPSDKLVTQLRILLDGQV